MSTRLFTMREPIALVETCNAFYTSCITIWFQTKHVCVKVQGIEYSRVCGKIIAYQYASPGSFWDIYRSGNTINDNYVDGISLTYGNPRAHIWTLLLLLKSLVLLLILAAHAQIFTMLDLHLCHLVLLGLIIFVTLATQNVGSRGSMLMLPYGMELVVDQPTRTFSVV